MVPVLIFVLDSFTILLRFIKHIMIRMLLQQQSKNRNTIASRNTLRRMMYGNRLLLCCAAATFTTLPGGHAFLVTRPPVRMTPMITTSPPSCTIHGQSVPSHPVSYTSIRRFSSRNGNNNDGGGGVLDTIKNAAKSVAKSILPSSWFQTEREKQRAIERQRVKDDVKGGLTELLKDAPLPVRMMGRMMGPLVSSAMSTMAESMAEQQKTVEETLSRANTFLQSDEDVTRLLGPNPQVGTPLSQSSSTTSINGRTKTRIQIGFPVTGSRASGMAQLSATEAGIERIVVQVDGRQIDVNLTSSKRRKSFSGNGNDDDDNIIEAEIIEKDTRR